MMMREEEPEEEEETRRKGDCTLRAAAMVTTGLGAPEGAAEDHHFPDVDPDGERREDGAERRRPARARRAPARPRSFPMASSRPLRGGGSMKPNSRGSMAPARELLDLEHDGLEAHALDLGEVVGREPRELGLGVEPVAGPGARAAGAALALLGARAAHPALLQAPDPAARVVQHLLAAARVHNEPDAVDRDARLGDVCRQDALAHAGLHGVEDAVLVLDSQAAVQPQHHPALRALCVLCEGVPDQRDVVHAGEETPGRRPAPRAGPPCRSSGGPAGTARGRGAVESSRPLPRGPPPLPGVRLGSPSGAAGGR